MTASCIHGIPCESGCIPCGRGTVTGTFDPKVIYTALPVWTEERVVSLLDTLATISRKLESIEYHIRTKR